VSNAARTTTEGHEVHRMLRRRLTYANVISTIALFLALGGVSFAAASGALAPNTVGSTQLRPKSLGTSELRD
jgi:hypothetical protein